MSTEGNPTESQTALHAGLAGDVHQVGMTAGHTGQSVIFGGSAAELSGRPDTNDLFGDALGGPRATSLGEYVPSQARQNAMPNSAAEVSTRVTDIDPRTIRPFTGIDPDLMAKVRARRAEASTPVEEPTAEEPEAPKPKSRQETREMLAELFKGDTDGTELNKFVHNVAQNKSLLYDLTKKLVSKKEAERVTSMLLTPAEREFEVEKLVKAAQAKIAAQEQRQAAAQLRATKAESRKARKEFAEGIKQRQAAQKEADRIAGHKAESRAAREKWMNQLESRREVKEARERSQPQALDTDELKERTAAIQAERDAAKEQAVNAIRQERNKQFLGANTHLFDTDKEKFLKMLGTEGADTSEVWARLVGLAELQQELGDGSLLNEVFNLQLKSEGKLTPGELDHAKSAFEDARNRYENGADNEEELFDLAWKVYETTGDDSLQIEAHRLTDPQPYTSEPDEEASSEADENPMLQHYTHEFADLEALFAATTDYEEKVRIHDAMYGVAQRYANETNDLRYFDIADRLSLKLRAVDVTNDEDDREQTDDDDHGPTWMHSDEAPVVFDLNGRPIERLVEPIPETEEESVSRLRAAFRRANDRLGMLVHRTLHGSPEREETDNKRRNIIIGSALGAGVLALVAVRTGMIHLPGGGGKHAEHLAPHLPKGHKIANGGHMLPAPRGGNSHTTATTVVNQGQAPNKGSLDSLSHLSPVEQHKLELISRNFHQMMRWQNNYINEQNLHADPKKYEKAATAFVKGVKYVEKLKSPKVSAPQAPLPNGWLNPPSLS